MVRPGSTIVARISGEDQSGGWRQVWGSRGRGRRVRTSRPDSAGGEEAEDAPDLPGRFDLTGVHRNDGGELDTVVAMELGLRREWGKATGEGEQVSEPVGVVEALVFLSARGSSTVRGMAPGWCGADVGDERVGGLFGRYREEEDEDFYRKPPGFLFCFSFNFKQQV